MTQLLVSVRSPAEARMALEQDAAIVDVKEPSRGPLGAADFSTVREVVEQIAGRKPVSIAAGELLSWDAGRAAQIPGGVSYVKLGLAECSEVPTWPEVWRRAVESFPAGVAPVGVVYADWLSAKAPLPEKVLEEACLLGCPFLLVDTFNKSTGGLLNAWPLEPLGRFAVSVHRRGLQLVLAGSLSETTILQILPLQPEFVGVRGAVCRGGRSGPIEADRIGRLVRLLSSS